jgi:hypothetical protein
MLRDARVSVLLDICESILGGCWADQSHCCVRVVVCVFWPYSLRILVFWGVRDAVRAWGLQFCEVQFDVPFLSNRLWGSLQAGRHIFVSLVVCALKAGFQQ